MDSASASPAGRLRLPDLPPAAPAGLPVVTHHHYVAPLGPGHRFPMSKYEALRLRLHDLGRIGDDNLCEPEPAPRAWLELAHDPGYVAAILDGTADRETMPRIGFPWSERLARRGRLSSAGTTLAGALALRFGLACNGAGGSHHAARGHGAGFCVFNDVAVATRTLQATGLVRTVLVVDLDVHQGDGTAGIFAGDPDVFTFSMHCERNYPARKVPSDRDVGLERGVGDAEYLEILERELALLLATECPDLVFYNAGVDPHADDRLGHLALTDEGLGRRDRMVVAACRDAGVPLAGVIGGGYGDDVHALARRHAGLFEAAAERYAAERSTAPGPASGPFLP